MHCSQIEAEEGFLTQLCLLVVVDIRLKEVFGDEVVLHAVALLVPLGPTGV